MSNSTTRRAAALLLALCTLLCVQGVARADALKNADPERYYVYVNIADQVLTVYEKDDDGEYTRIVRRMLCTTGAQLTPTPTGIYKLTARERFGKFANFNNEYARYWTQVVRGIYLHSIMFGKRDVEALKSNPYSVLGNRASHGCIRLYVEDAKWLYYNACPGTTIELGSQKGRLTAEERKGLRSTLSFAEYKAFQAGIFDDGVTDNVHAWITSDGAVMRTGNGSNDKYIRRLPGGVEVEVIQQCDPWVKILVDGREGYVKRIYVTYVKGGRDTYPDGRATKTTTNIYEAPDVKSEILCRMPRDTSLNILETYPDTGWYKIRYWNVEGYIRARNVRKDLSLYRYDEQAQLAAYAVAKQALDAEAAQAALDAAAAEPPSAEELAEDALFNG